MGAWLGDTTACARAAMARDPSASAEKHHEDYSKPLEVAWVCRPCHLRIHAEKGVTRT